jgi:hypothetical protein
MSETSFMSSDWLGAFLIIAILFGGGNFFGGRGGAPMPNLATTQDVNDAVNAQATQQGLRDILLSSANNNYETARLIDNQTMFLSNQNNTNTLAAINGFNDIKQSIGALSAQMNECCCSIKTMMLENRLQDTQIALQNEQNKAINAEQSQYLLGVMGKWVANAPATTT